MAPSRRRTRSGIPIAVIVAVLTALFAAFGNRNRAEPSRRGTEPTVTASSPSQTATGTTGRRASTGREPGAPSATPSRSNSPGFATRQRLTEHYEKHGAEFPGFSLDQYLSAAQALRDAPVSAIVLEVRRRDGVVTRFDRQSGAFLAANRDGTIRTFFRPNDGESYFRRQASRTPGGGT